MKVVSLNSSVVSKARDSLQRTWTHPRVGVVIPCVDTDRALCVRDRPLEEIWRSPEFQMQRREVHRCNSSCWDTTNAELSTRLRERSLIRDLALTWKDIGFYYGKDGS